MKIKSQLDLINVLKRIRDIPNNTHQGCHEDHKEMSKELGIVIEKLLIKRLKGIKE